MKIAVTYSEGNIFQHFGKSEQFKVYDITDNKITGSEVVNTNGSGHGALAGFLKNINAEVLICGGIGGGAIDALKDAGIKVYGGANGDTDKNVQAFLDGKLVYSPNVKCSHHDHEHGEAHHHCGDHGCGNHGEEGGHHCHH